MSEIALDPATAIRDLGWTIYESQNYEGDPNPSWRAQRQVGAEIREAHAGTLEALLENVRWQDSQFTKRESAEDVVA